MANKLRRIFRRSEYLGALDNYRKARRRGDAADAQRWIKVADMHLRLADRFDTGVYATLMREIGYQEAKARSVKLAEDRAAFQEAEASRIAAAALDKVMDGLEPRLREKWEMDPVDD